MREGRQAIAGFCHALPGLSGRKWGPPVDRGLFFNTQECPILGGEPAGVHRST